MAFISLPPRLAFIHPWQEDEVDEQVLVSRVMPVTVPESIKDTDSLMKWAADNYGVAGFLGTVGATAHWIRVTHTLPSMDLPLDFNIHFRVAPEDLSLSDWGNDLALGMAPSSIDHKTAIRLQGLDPITLEPLGSTPSFFNYRPVSAMPPLPSTLIHPVFARFWSIFHGVDGAEEPGEEDYEAFVELTSICSKYFAEEADYRDVVKVFWDSYANVEFLNELNTGGRCDLGARILALKALFASLETKLGMSGNKSDPGLQASQYVRLYWTRKGNLLRFENTCFPALAIEHVGPNIRVSAVAVLNCLCCMPLTPFINLLPMYSHDLEAAKQGARLCLAVKVALGQLESFYTDFKRGPRRDLFFRKCIPYPLHQCKIPPARFPNKLVFRVQEAGQPRLVVKFVQRPYGEAVHEAWAAAGLAPRLLGVTKLAGGWWQVSMEYLGEDEWSNLQTRPDAEELRPVVLEALARAHALPVNEQGEVGVHGDMRDANVMVLGNGSKVKFVDFDWARPEGSPSACYPPFINHRQVCWPDGVKVGSKMLQRHDQELLSRKQAEQARVRLNPFLFS